MSEYHKIETLYERDEQTHKLKDPLILKNRIYGCVNPWVWTEKVDGTNIRVLWDGVAVKFAGRSDNAALHPHLLAYMEATVTAEKLGAIFPGESVVLYGEGYGAGIQKGGGDYSADKRLILFDVRVGQWWLSDENVRDVAAKIGLPAVPLYGEMTLAEATQRVRSGIPSMVGNRDMEGLVGRPVEALFDKKGARLIVKLKTRDFA